MKTVLILRHAKSSWKHPDLDDHDRPLNRRGLRDAPRIGRLIAGADLVPDLIFSSSAVRARTTAEAVAAESGYTGPIEIKRELYLAEPSVYLELLAGLDDRFGRVMVVGHNPGMADLVEELTGTFDAFPTAALAHVRLPIEGWQAAYARLRGELIDLWQPRELPD